MINLKMTHTGMKVKVKCSNPEDRGSFYSNNHDFLLHLERLIGSVALYEDVKIEITREPEPTDNLVADYDCCNPPYATVPQEKC